MGGCNHEMPGLPYPAFRRMNAEPGGGKPSPYTRRGTGILPVMFMARMAMPRLLAVRHRLSRSPWHFRAL